MDKKLSLQTLVLPLDMRLTHIKCMCSKTQCAVILNTATISVEVQPSDRKVTWLTNEKKIKDIYFPFYFKFIL